MLAYRIFPYLPSARDEGAAGHPHYLHRPQGSSRLDNPGYYDVWYLAMDAAGAVGEVFGDISDWRDEMFEFPRLSGSRRAMGLYWFPDETPLLELDDARNLLIRGLRPTQVVERNRAATQSWALNIHGERNDRGQRMWSGVRWWSYHRPQWRTIGLWGHKPECHDVWPLDMSHPAVVDAARALRRRLV